jgi:N-dimethylarginine dimethylaminohydrolase
MTTSNVTDPPVRVCDCTDLKFGDVVTDVAGDKWVFVGYTTRTTGRCAHFAKSVEGMETFRSQLWQYEVDFAPAMLAKFPDAVKYVTGKITRKEQ